jgi:flagellum-specific ATP synthase
VGFTELCHRVSEVPVVHFYGRVERVRRDSVRLSLPGVQVGSLCEIDSALGPVRVEIVSLDPEGHIAMPLDDLEGVRLGDKVKILEISAMVPVGEALLGQVVDSTCQPYDSTEPLPLGGRLKLQGERMNPMGRANIDKPLDLGIRAINACLACGEGQRQGIFAGSGVGKSVLLGMMARYTSADIVVIALIGERGREVKEFLESELGAEAMKKSIVVVETSDKSAVRRVRGAFVASSIAEHFRAKGQKVLLMMDSLTRFAMAQREIGIAAGEPPTSKGYPPSVFSSMAKLLERAGNWGTEGSITGLYTVLVEGDDLEDPVADSARSILDGHIVLSRKLANRGQYPAIDVLSSISRVMDRIVKKEHSAAARELKKTLSKFLENEDAVQYGAYTRGTDPEMDNCIEMAPRIYEFLRQDRDVRKTFGESRNELEELLKSAR